MRWSIVCPAARPLFIPILNPATVLSDMVDLDPERVEEMIDGRASQAQKDRRKLLRGGSAVPSCARELRDTGPE